MARGSIVKRASGSYAIRYWDNTGRRHYETAGRSRKDAEHALTARLNAINTGTWRQPSQETLTQYATRWLQWRDPTRTLTDQEGRLNRNRLAPSTHREYRRALELHVLPTLGHRPLTNIRPLDIDQLIHHLESQGLAPGTIRNTITPLRRLLYDAVRHELIATNPASRPDLPPAQDFIGQELPPDHSTRIRNALVQLAPANPLRQEEPDLIWVHLFDLALGTGLRLGELRALQWQHIDREKRLLRVEQAYSRSQLKKPKSDAGTRTIPIFDSTQNALDALAARALEHGTYAPTQLIFQTTTGKPLQPSNFNRRTWQPALRHANLSKPNGKPQYRLHDLRHTCISRLVAAGADIKLVQAIAGHSNPLITLKRYSHLLDQRLTEIAERYEPAPRPQRTG